MSKKDKLSAVDQFENDMKGSSSVSQFEQDIQANKIPIYSSRSNETDFNIGKAEREAQKQKEFDDSINKMMDELPGLNDAEKKTILDLGKTQKYSVAQMNGFIDTFRGANPIQNKYVADDKDGKLYLADITPIDAAAKNQKELGFWGAVEEGTQNLMAITGQKLGQGHYYMKDGVPVPLAVGQKAEAGYTVDSIWGSDQEAQDDSRITDIGKKIFNVVPSIIGGILALPELAQGLATGKTEAAFKVASQEFESYKFKTSEEFNKNIVDTSKIKEFGDVFSSEIYDLSPDKIMNTAVNVGQSILQFVATRGIFKAAGFANTPALYAASFTNNLAEPIKASEDAGIEGRSKYVVSLAYSTVASIIEAKLGFEGKIFGGEARVAQKAMIKNLIKENVDIVDGKITKESIERLMKETAKKTVGFFEKYGKSGSGEMTEEVLQNMTQNGVQEIHDNLMKDDPESAKYNTKFWSPKALGEYINSAISGAIGGVGGSLVMGGDKQTESVYSAIEQGPEKVNELKTNLVSSLKRGAISQDDFDRANFKIDAYQAYYEATKDKPIPSEDKKTIFDLTYQKENLKASIESLEKNNPGGINDVFIAAKKKEVEEITKQANEIWTKAEAKANPTKANPVAPHWSEKVNEVSKNVGNPSNTPSQVLTTKEKVNEALGLTPELNELAKEFSIEFKVPSMTPEMPNIRVKGGEMIIPTETEVKGKEGTVEKKIVDVKIPAYAIKDTEGNTWLFGHNENASEDKASSYLVKLNPDGSFEDVQEIKYETTKKNELNMDNLPEVFDTLGIKPIATEKAAATTEFEYDEENDEVVPEDKRVFGIAKQQVESGVSSGTITQNEDGSVSANIGGFNVSFTGDVNAANIPEDGNVTLEANEDGSINVSGPNGQIGVISEPQETIEDNEFESEVEIPTELTPAAQKVLDTIREDSANYTETKDDGLTTYWKGKEAYRRVSDFVNTKFTGSKEQQKDSIDAGNIIKEIFGNFFNGRIKSYKDYEKNISQKDYNKVIHQLIKAKEFAKSNGLSIITENLIIADDSNKVAGKPELLMIDKDGNLYIYDVTTVKSYGGKSAGQLLGKKWESGSRADTISKRVNAYADILKNKFDIDTKGLGVIPFEIDYDASKNGESVYIKSVKLTDKLKFYRNPTKILNTKQESPKKKKGDYAEGKTAYDKAIEEGMQFSNEQEAFEYVAENSENPNEVAENYLIIPDVQRNLSDKEKIIEDNYVQMTREEFDKILDPNMMGQTLGMRFIYKKSNQNAVPIDVKLHELSEQYGIEITTQDMADWMAKYAQGVGSRTGIKGKFRDKFFELTGEELTRAKARKLVENQLKKENKEYEKYLDNESRSLAEDESAFYDKIRNGEIRIEGSEDGSNAEGNQKSENRKEGIERRRQEKSNTKVEEIVNRGENKKESKPITKEDRNNKVDFDSLFSNISKVLSGEIKSEKEEANKLLKQYLKEIHPDKFQDENQKLIAEIFTTAMINVGRKGDITKLNELYNQYKEINAEYDAELGNKDDQFQKESKTKGDVKYNSKNLPKSTGDFDVVESIPYTSVEANKFKPAQQLKFNQGSFEAVRIVADEDMITFISMGSKILNALRKGEPYWVNKELQKKLEAKYGITAIEANKRAKELAKKNRTSYQEVIIILGTKNSYDGDQFQKVNKNKATKEVLDRVIAALKKANSSLKIYPDSGLVDKQGNPAAAKVDKNANVLVNFNYAGKDTPIHEVGHILIDAIGGTSNLVVRKAIKQLKDTALWKEIAPNYKELSEDMLGKEVLAEAIGREGAGIFETEEQKSAFRKLMEYIFDRIKAVLGINKNIAKSLAKEVLAGRYKVPENMEEQFQKDRIKTEKEYYNDKYLDAGGYGISLQELKNSIARAEAKLAKDPTNESLKEELEGVQAKLDKFDKSYKKYSFDYNKINKVKEANNLEGKSIEELLELYNDISGMDTSSDPSFFADVKFRIAALVAEEQRQFLESKGVNVKPNFFKDIKYKDTLMKSLGHMTQDFPELQYLSKAYDTAVREMNMERREASIKLNELGKAVAKENTLGLKVKDFFSGKAYKFFEWMDNGKGELISTDAAYSLSKAKGDYMKFYRELKEQYKEVQEGTPAGFDENTVLKTEKGFAERLESKGIVSAIQSWLGSNQGMKQVVMKFTSADGKTEQLTFDEIEQKLQKEGESGKISAATASAKSAYYNMRAKRLLKKGTDDAGNDVSKYKADFVLDRNGKLMNKFGVKRADEFDYSKDFHAAAVQYINDMTWTKHMQPLVPLVESIEHFSKTTGVNKGAKPNLAKWVDNWKKMHVYQEKPYSALPELDLVMKTLRNLTSMTSLAFNVASAKMNFVVGEYNNWRELGAKDMAKGIGRLAPKMKGGKRKFSKKAHNILMKYGVVATDYDEKTGFKAGEMFRYAAQGLTKATEYFVQGSLFFGQMSKQEFADFDEQGNYTGSDPNITEKIEAYKKKVSNIHGKYSAKDRRNFELYEFGKFAGQFRTWVPDWWKERFGDEYYDENGIRHKGNWNGFFKYAVKELRKDIMKPEFWTSDKLEYVNARKNLKAAMTLGLLMALQAQGDDDKKRRKKGDFLSQAIGNLTFIFDPNQAKYVLKTPFAGMSYANNILDLMTDLNAKKLKKVTPYGKLGDILPD